MPRSADTSLCNKFWILTKHHHQPLPWQPHFIAPIREVGVGSDAFFQVFSPPSLWHTTLHILYEGQHSLNYYCAASSVHNSPLCVSRKITKKSHAGTDSPTERKTISGAQQEPGWKERAGDCASVLTSAEEFRSVYRCVFGRHGESQSFNFDCITSNTARFYFSIVKLLC